MFWKRLFRLSPPPHAHWIGQPMLNLRFSFGLAGGDWNWFVLQASANRIWSRPQNASEQLAHAHSNPNCALQVSAVDVHNVSSLKNTLQYLLLQDVSRCSWSVWTNVQCPRFAYVADYKSVPAYLQAPWLQPSLKESSQTSRPRHANRKNTLWTFPTKGASVFPWTSEMNPSCHLAGTDGAPAGRLRRWISWHVSFQAAIEFEPRKHNLLMQLDVADVQVWANFHATSDEGLWLRWSLSFMILCDSRSFLYFPIDLIGGCPRKKQCNATAIITSWQSYQLLRSPVDRVRNAEEAFYFPSTRWLMVFVQPRLNTCQAYSGDAYKNVSNRSCTYCLRNLGLDPRHGWILSGTTPHGSTGTVVAQAEWDAWGWDIQNS